MKKILFLSLSSLIIIGGLTGCNKKESKNKIKNGIAFTITCTEKEDKGDGYKINSVITYDFGDDQYLKEYTIVTNQKYSNKATYETYKIAQEKAANEESNNNITYTLKSDDDKLTLVFTTIVKDLDKAELSDEDKEKSKAINVLNSLESEDEVTCELEGIKKSKLK